MTLHSTALIRMLLALGLALGTAHAQRDGGVPLLTAEERAAIDAQAADFNRAIDPILAAAAASTVRVWSGTQRLAYGTVVGDGGEVLTKWSELLRSRGDLRVEAGAGELRGVELIGVYPEYDLALLGLLGEPLTPVTWAEDHDLALGSFLATPQPDGRLAAFGVVGVLPRNLRDADQAFLGVQGDPEHDGKGVRVAAVIEESAAANADIRKGDLILAVDGREVNGPFELRNSLNGVPPGADLPLRISRNGTELDFDVVMGSRPQLPRFPGGRLQQMERMGGPISRVREDFPIAIESDMRPLPNQVGGPVVDIQGRAVGLTLARAGRTRSYIMPASAVLAVLATEATDPLDAEEALAAANTRNPRRQGIQAPRGGAGGDSSAPGRGNPPSVERLGRHLSDMQRLLELMRDEMEALDR